MTIQIDQMTGRLSTYMPNRVVVLCSLITMLSFFPFSKADEIVGEYSLPYFNSYSTAQGLSQITVYNFTQDKFGFMWMATQAGIDRFDGYEFVQYGKANTNDPTSGLLGVTVYDIKADPDNGDIWAATINGLSRLDRKTNQFKHYPLEDDDGELHYVVTTIFFDSKKQLWIATNKGLFKYDSEQDKFAQAPNSHIETAFTFQIDEDLNGNLWLATGLGLYRYSSSGLVKVAQQEGVELQTLHVDQRGNLWVGTNGKGLFKYAVNDAGELLAIFSVSKEQGLADAIVVDIKQMRDNAIWVATENGLSIFPDPEQEDVVNVVNKEGSGSNLADNTLSSLFQSHAGTIFVGTWVNGFSIYDPDSIKFSRYVLGGNSDTRGIDADEDDNIWLANKLGLWKITNETEAEGPWFYEGQSEFGYTTHKIISIKHSSISNRVWIASRLGLGSYQDGAQHIEEVALQGKPIYSVTEDSAGNLWLGTYNDGLYRYSPEKQEITGHWVLPLIPRVHATSEQEVWIATIFGIHRLFTETGEMQHFIHDPNNPTSLSHNVVTWISRASEDTYWIGTQAGGLNLMTVTGNSPDDVTFEVQAKKSKLTNLSIGAVIPDKDGMLWISTTEGVTKYDPVNEQMFFYDGRNGANNTGYYIGGGAKTKSDKIMFAGAMGLTHFYPDDIALSEFEPNVYLTSIEILNSPSHIHEIDHVPNPKEVFQQRELYLSPGDILFSVEFTSLDYTQPRSNQYAYRLTGFDERWRYVFADRRSATFTNLDPGVYQLQVKATNKDGIWSAHQSYLDIYVAPSWWQTQWAIGGFALMIFGIFFSIYKWRLFSLKQRSKELRSLVDSQTKELQNAIEKLTFLSTIDPLTELSNRRDFNTKANQELERYKRYGRKFSLILLDIDHFKEVNDTYGHDAGDRVLELLAKLLKQHTRVQDVVARWGGEEFICLIPESSLEQAKSVAEKLRESVAAEEYIYEEHRLSISVTVGYAEIRDDESVQDLIRRTDSYLYRGKTSGRDSINSGDET